MTDRIGVALGGGSARGYAHIGVLEELVRAGVRCDMVSGTSMGALVGAAFAGQKLDRFKELACGITLAEIPRLLSPTISSHGLFSGRRVVRLLQKTLGDVRFEDLALPFAAVSVDILSGELVVLRDGQLIPAVRASFAIPAFFTPVRSDERLLVDGGVLEPVPVQAARNLGAQKVIAVDLFGQYPPDERTYEEVQEYERQLRTENTGRVLDRVSRAAEAIGFRFPLTGGPSREPERIGSVEILERTMALMQNVLTRHRLAEHPAEVVLRPRLNHVGLLDFHRAEAIIEAGRTAVRDHWKEIEAILV